MISLGGLGTGHWKVFGRLGTKGRADQGIPIRPGCFARAAWYEHAQTSMSIRGHDARLLTQLQAGENPAPRDF